MMFCRHTNDISDIRTVDSMRCMRARSEIRVVDPKGQIIGLQGSNTSNVLFGSLDP